jgi:hypothetical protein
MTATLQDHHIQKGQQTQLQITLLNSILRFHHKPAIKSSK